MGAIVTVDTATCYAERSWTGVETSFVAGFKAEQTADVKVYSRDSAGVETLLTEAVHYTVTLGSDGAVTVVPVALPAAPKTILILRDTSPLQAIDFANLGAYSPSTHTQLHSRAAMRDAEDKYHRARAYLVPKGETADAIPPIAIRKGGVLGWDPVTGLIKIYTPSAAQFTFGAGAPNNANGANGDVYLNTANGNIYLKVAGAWVLQGNIAGPAGKSGFAYLWSTNTTASDPTAGKIKMNNAAAASATAVYISETDNDGNNLAAEIATWDDSSSTIHGRLKLYNPNIPSNFALFDVTGGNTDNGAWDTVNVSYVAGGGTFSNADNIAVVFAPKGDKGDAGTNGTNGIDAGFKYAWSTNTASTDPGSGTVKGNNATASSITNLYISETDANTNALAAELATWDDSTSTNKARVRIYDPATPSNFVEFFVTGALVDNGAWDTLPVTYITGGGTFANGATVRIETFLIGDKGAAGAGSGDVLGPATNSDGFIPQWNGANSKTLKNGLANSTLGAALLNAGTKTAHGLLTGNGTSEPGVTAAGTDGQLLVGQTGADPQWKSASGDISAVTAAGAFTIANNAITDAKLDAAHKAGKQTIWIPGDAMKSRTTTGAPTAQNTETATNKVQIHGPDFDPSTQQHVQFDTWMPKSYDAGTVTAVFVWEHPSTSTNFAVVWGIQGFALADNAAIDTAFGTAQEVTDTGGTTNNQYISPETSAITIGNTPAGEKLVRWQVYRKAADAADTLAVAARLLGVRILYNTNALNDT